VPAPVRAVEAFASILPLGLFELGADGHVEWANERWYELVGRTPGRSALQWLDTLHLLDRSAAAVASGRLAGGGEVALDHRVSLPDGGLRWLHSRARLVDGVVVGYSRDLSPDRAMATELDVLRTVAEKHSRTDPLTRVATRLYVKERLAAELARSDRDGATPGLVLVELQGLRTINERLGHASGDAVLLEVATRLAGVVRRYDTVARWDGARFAVLAPSVTSQAALTAVAAKLQAAIEREPVHVEGVAMPVFATVGCARAVGRGHRAEVVVDAAEAALQDARAVGPGGVRLAPDSPSVVDASGGEAVRLARALALSAAAREGVPESHAADVADLAARVARALELAPRSVLTCRLAGWLHDVGMVAVPDAILAETGELTGAEWAVLRTHPVEGERIVRRVGGLELAAIAVRHHHERWDGRGYPDALGGEDIPYEARIVAAADAWASMTEDRRHRAARTPAAALAELERVAGSQLDPGVVGALVGLVAPRAAA